MSGAASTESRASALRTVHTSPAIRHLLCNPADLPRTFRLSQPRDYLLVMIRWERCLLHQHRRLSDQRQIDRRHDAP